MAKIAMPVGPEFEDSEYTKPYERLCGAGHEVVVLGTKKGELVKGKRGKAQVRIEHTAADVDPSSFDALVIPGGHSPDHLRTDPALVAFVRRFCEAGRLVAAVCHGPQLLIEADAVRGRTMTSWPSVRKDLENAGAKWVDREVVEDGNLVTSRKPDDLDAFNEVLLRRLARAAERHAAAGAG